MNLILTGASKQLATMIEGESLLNDGAAIVFFEVFLLMAMVKTGVGVSGEYDQEYLHLSINYFFIKLCCRMLKPKAAQILFTF